MEEAENAGGTNGTGTHELRDGCRFVRCQVRRPKKRRRKPKKKRLKRKMRCAPSMFLPPMRQNLI